MSHLKGERIDTDVLVIGTGGAGCFAAMKVKERGLKVTVVNKAPWLGGCTMMARAGFSAALDPKDTPATHLRDSVAGGHYMGNQKVLKAMCQKNVEATKDLIRWGAAFRKGPDGTLELGNMVGAGHTYPRMVRVEGDLSHVGKAVMDVLQSQMRTRGIGVIGNVMITKLLHSGGSVAGCVGVNWRDGTLMVFRAKAVVVATGGTGRLYKYTDNPTYVTGDGHAMMYEAGAELVDMEFCDFQLGSYSPPQIYGYPPNCVVWLTSGGMLLNRDGERFFGRYFPDRANEGACLRSEINKAAAWEILDGRGSPNGMVYLNCSNVPRDWMMTARADMVAHYKKAGIDLTWQPMEVAPGNHTWLGGLRIDENAESVNLKGLYAAGETAGGWGGANRLGGNAVAAAFGLGVAAGESAAERAENGPLPAIDESQVEEERKRIESLLDRKEGVRAQKIKAEVQDLMQKNVWLKREQKGLKATIKALEEIEKEELPRLCVPRGKEMQRYLWLREALEASNLVLCGRIVTTAALNRKESRGGHQRADYPETDNKNWLKNIVICREKGKMTVRTEPVVATEVPIPKE